MPEAGKDPFGDSEGQDTDERFEDHPEMAPSQARMSVEKVPDLDEEARKRSQAGDPVEEAGDRRHKVDLDFARNQDFGGNEGSLGTQPDFSRGSGFLGGKLVGEGPSGEDRLTDSGGFPPSENQERNVEAIRREETGGGDWSAHPAESEGHASQGRDYPRPVQATGIQAFGRDVGASGHFQAGPEDRAEDSFGEGPAQAPPNHKVWAGILKRLGGSSPGSEENLQLAELFSRVQFPADREGVFAKLAQGAEFRLREGIVVDLHQALEHSRARIFRNIGDLVDCVKDELRRMEADGLKVLKMA